jgi:hypothetical protein
MAEAAIRISAGIAGSAEPGFVPDIHPASFIPVYVRYAIFPRFSVQI